MPKPLRRYFGSRFTEPAIAAIGVTAFVVVLSFAPGAATTVFAWAFIVSLGVFVVAGYAGIKRDSFCREPVTDEELAWMADVLTHELHDYRYHVILEAESRRGIDRALVVEVAREFRRRMDKGAIPSTRSLTDPRVREALGTIQPDTHRAPERGDALAALESLRDIPDLLWGAAESHWADITPHGNAREAQEYANGYRFACRHFSKEIARRVEAALAATRPDNGPCEHASHTFSEPAGRFVCEQCGEKTNSPRKHHLAAVQASGG